MGVWLIRPLLESNQTLKIPQWQSKSELQQSNVKISHWQKLSEALGLFTQHIAEAPLAASTVSGFLRCDSQTLQTWTWGFSVVSGDPLKLLSWRPLLLSTNDLQPDRAWVLFRDVRLGWSGDTDGLIKYFHLLSSIFYLSYTVFLMHCHWLWA